MKLTNNTMDESISLSRSKLYLFIILFLCGIGFRFLVPALGHNFDFDSYLVVADIVDKGQNVYVSTSRYNYAPFWFNFLHLLYQIANKDPMSFRYLLVGALTVVDLLIFMILYKKIGSLVAFLRVASKENVTEGVVVASKSMLLSQPY